MYLVSQKSMIISNFLVIQTYIYISCSINCSDGKDLLRTVAELKQAHRKLSEQNSSLLRTVAQCEDVNLQLTLEVTDLRGKLARQSLLC